MGGQGLNRGQSCARQRSYPLNRLSGPTIGDIELLSSLFPLLLVARAWWWCLPPAVLAGVAHTLAFWLYRSFGDCVALPRMLTRSCITRLV